MNPNKEFTVIKVSGEEDAKGEQKDIVVLKSYSAIGTSQLKLVLPHNSNSNGYELGDAYILTLSDPEGVI